MAEKEYPPLSSRNNTAPSTVTNSPLPHPLDGEWLVRVDDDVYGPFSGHDLKEMAQEDRLEHDSFVQKVGGSGNWTKAADDRALAKFFMPTPRALPTRTASVSAGDRAQIVTVNNSISTQPAYLGEKPVDKTPFLAAILSLFIVGVGQMYNGEVGKGILMLIGCALLWTVMLGWIVNIWSIIDAYTVASRKHDAYDRWMDASSAAARAQASS